MKLLRTNLRYIDLDQSDGDVDNDTTDDELRQTTRPNTRPGSSDLNFVKGTQY